MALLLNMSLLLSLVSCLTEYRPSQVNYYFLDAMKNRTQKDIEETILVLTTNIQLCQQFNASNKAAVVAQLPGLLYPMH